MPSRSYRPPRRCASRAARSRRHGSRSAASRAKPWRAREAEGILAGSRAGSRAVRRAAEAALARGEALRRQRLQDRARAADRRARPHARRSRNARARARPAGLPLLLRFRSASTMSEISLTQVAGACPARLEHRPAAHPPRRRCSRSRARARYAADNHPPGMLYAVLAVSSIARGRVDLPRRRGREGASRRRRGDDAGQPAAARRRIRTRRRTPSCSGSTLLQNDRVRYANQPIAVVIAETLEAATEGAALLAPRYEAEPARVGLDAAESFVPPAVGVGNPAEVHRGDVEAGLAAASQRIEATYETPPQYHNAMEPHAIVAAWDGDTLSIDTPSQGLVMAQGAHRGTVRHPAGEHPHPQPVPRRRLRLQGLRLRAADSRHPGRACWSAGR